MKFSTPCFRFQRPCPGWEGFRFRSRNWLVSTVFIVLLCHHGFSKETEIPSIITNLATLKNLTPEQASRKIPVLVEAVTTLARPNSFLFLHDGSAGVFVSAQSAFDLKPGMRVRAQGISGPGEFAPVLQGLNGDPILTSLGFAPFPEARKTAIEQIIRPDNDADWLELSGVIRNASSVEDKVYLEIGTLHSQVRAIFSDATLAFFTNMIDAEATIRGVGGSVFNRQRQLTGMRLFVPSTNEIFLTKSPPPDPFQLPLREPHMLMQYRPGEGLDHRIRVRGVLTFSQPGRSLYLTGPEGGLQVLTSDRSALIPGAIIDAVGFPALGDNKPLLHHSLVRQVAEGPFPTPRKIDMKQAASGQFLRPNDDAEFVEVEAILVDQIRRSSDQVLILQAGNSVFNAHLDTLANPPLTIQNGSRLRLSGIGNVQLESSDSVDEFFRSWTFRLLLRTPKDVVILQQPGWWNLRRTLWAAGFLLVAVLLSTAWTAFLARKSKMLQEQVTERLKAEKGLQQAKDELEHRVAKRTEELSSTNDRLRQQIIERKKAEQRLLEVELNHRVEKERSRIAKDIHDDLGSSLTQVALLGEMAENSAEQPNEVRIYSKKISSTARAITRTLDRIVWAVNPRNDSLESLMSYVFKFAQEYLAPLDIRLRIDAPVNLPGNPLLAATRHNLFLTIKEILHNIVKHSSATEVWIRLWFEGINLVLSIEDNGCGMESMPFTPPSGLGGNGLTNIKARIEEIGGVLTCNRRMEGGTSVQIILPIPPAGLNAG